MVRLGEADYRKALEVLYAAEEADGPLAFPHPVLQALRDLVPCEVVAFHDGRAPAEPALVYAGEPAGEMTAEIRAAHCRLRHEDPVRPATGARMLSEAVSLREFRRLDLYREVHRPLGVEHLLWLYLEPQASDARLEFDRVEANFGERDKRILNLLLPHLQHFLRAARDRVGPRGVRMLTPREREVITHVAVGRTNGEIAWLLKISPATVRKHLENAYAKLGVHTRTGAVAAVFRTRWGPHSDVG